MLSFIAGGITHSFGLYLIPVTEYLEVGRETFGFAFALQGFIAGAGAFIFGAISDKYGSGIASFIGAILFICLLYTSPSPRDGLLSRMPSSA